jgi:hypothetical protein
LSEIEQRPFQNKQRVSRKTKWSKNNMRNLRNMTKSNLKKAAHAINSTNGQSHISREHDKVTDQTGKPNQKGKI